MYLPSERALAKDFRTSRVTVANALHALEHDRLVLRTPGRGTRVLPVLERLSQPRIGIIHGDRSAMEAVERQDSWRTFQGVTETLDRLGYRYELMNVPSSDDLPAD